MNPPDAPGMVPRPSNMSRRLAAVERRYERRDIPIPRPYCEDELVTAEQAQKWPSFDPAFRTTEKRIEKDMDGNYHDVTHGGNWTAGDFVYLPNEYTIHGDVALINSPLICTSLKELADEGWLLIVYYKYVHLHNHTKIRFHFTDKKPNRYLTFKLWAQGRLTTKDAILLAFIKSNPIPNFSKPPITHLPALREKTEEVTVEQMIPYVPLADELAVLEHWNDIRRRALAARRIRIFDIPEDDVRPENDGGEAAA